MSDDFSVDAFIEQVNRAAEDSYTQDEIGFRFHTLPELEKRIESAKEQAVVALALAINLTRLLELKKALAAANVPEPTHVKTAPEEEILAVWKQLSRSQKSELLSELAEEQGAATFEGEKGQLAPTDGTTNPNRCYPWR